MIIFQIIQKPQQRGAEIFAAQLSEQLQQLEHQVVLISLFEGTADLPFSGEMIRFNRALSKRWFDVIAWKKIAQLVKERNPDLIQCNAGDTLKFAILSKMLFGWKTPVIARNASIVSSYIQSPIIKKINAFLYKNVAKIISVSEHSAKDLNALFPFTINKTTVIPIGINHVEIHPVTWKDRAESAKHVVHVGGFTFEKNHEGLLRIWKQILISHPDTVLHLLGNGPLREVIQNEVKVQGLEKSILFYGWVARPWDYIAKADVLVLPSIIEGLPGVLLEAMYCKTAVVAYNVGGISEIIQNETTGFLVDPKDEDAFVQAVEKAISIDTEMMEEKAFQLVNDNFTNVSIAREFERVYFSMVEDYINNATKLI